MKHNWVFLLIWCWFLLSCAGSNVTEPAPCSIIFVEDKVEQKPEIIGGYKRLASLLHYPEAARFRRIGGVVSLECLVNKDGHVLDVHALSKLGYGLEEASIKAVRKLKFEAARLGGKDVCCRTLVQVVFSAPR